MAGLLLLLVMPGVGRLIWFTLQIVSKVCKRHRYEQQSDEANSLMRLITGAKLQGLCVENTARETSWWFL